MQDVTMQDLLNDLRTFADTLTLLNDLKTFADALALLTSISAIGALL